MTLTINELFLCLALGALSNTTFNMKKSALKTACEVSRDLIENSTKNNLSPFIVASLIHTESRYDYKAVSPVGACGLTQVLPKYVQYSCNDLKKPKTSLKAGTQALNFWYNYKKKDIKKALECYNSGYHCNSPNYAKDILYKAKKLKHKYNEIKVTMEKTK